MKGAKFRVSGQLIADALAMPKGTEIRYIAKENPFADVFTFYVSHEDLPETSEAGEPQEISPRIEQVATPRDWLKFIWNV